MIKRELSVSVTNPKGGENVWTCVSYPIINENEEYKTIGLRGFDYKLFDGEEGGGTREGLDGYPYLNNLFQL